MARDIPLENEGDTKLRFIPSKTEKLRRTVTNGSMILACCCESSTSSNRTSKLIQLLLPFSLSIQGFNQRFKAFSLNLHVRHGYRIRRTLTLLNRYQFIPRFCFRNTIRRLQHLLLTLRCKIGRILLRSAHGIKQFLKKMLTKIAQESSRNT